MADDYFTPITCCTLGGGSPALMQEPAVEPLPISATEGGVDTINNTMNETKTSSRAAPVYSKVKDNEKSKYPPEFLPILIIPGFMSSGLEIIESKLRPSWEKQRLWLNLGALGISAVYFGNAQKTKTDDGTDNPEEDEQKQYKSYWLEHMRLKNDLRTEQTGIKVRPIPGLAGVDYLTPGTFTNLVSYVFGPVISALQKAGYEPGINLQAAPYDWRLPPSELEKRDSYFTRTMQQVEDLYDRSHSTPVVLLGHSLGTKTAHYFLNFCLQQKGQAWIDKYVHTYLPVGAPHLGAPKALRSTISGDKMSLDTFLNDEEALILGRSLGSGPWLLPQELPEGVPASAYVLPHGVLEIEVQDPLDTNQLVCQRLAVSKPFYYQLIVTCGKNGQHKVCTPFQRTTPGRDVVTFDGKISFATDPNPHSGDERFLRFFLQEPGLASAKYEEKPEHPCAPLCCFLKCIFCCCICDLVFRIIRLLLCGVVQAGVLSADAITGAAGGGANLAFSEGIVVPHRVWKGETANLQIPLYHKDDYGKADRFLCFMSMKEPRKVYLNIKLTWKPYNSQKSFRRICSPICQPSSDNEPLQITKQGKDYQEFPGYDIMEREGLTNILQMIKDVYDGDSEIGPRSISSLDPPPVQRVHAIYGINLPTEIGAVYKREDTCLSESKLQSLYVLDNAATLKSSTHTRYTVKSGLLMETPETAQKVAGGRKVSGDGTVPFWSLQHSKTWKSPNCDVTVVELDRAEHREILADSRFHQEILKYCRIRKETV